MRIKLLACSTAVFFALTTSASAAYFMSYGQAKHATKETVETVCSEVSNCTGYGVGGCRRNTQSNFSCVGALFYEGLYPGEEEECNRVIRWGVNGQGYIALRGIQRAVCFAV
jgi:hypothetical protein